MKYDFLFVYNVPHDTKGRMYARALQQVFVGLCKFTLCFSSRSPSLTSFSDLAELCMIGLFSLSLGSDSSKGRTLGPLVLLVILLVITALYHIYINRRLHPLMRYLPSTIMTDRLAPSAVDNTVYLQPSFKEKPPLLWIPKDKAGVSAEEIKGSADVIRMTDEGAFLDNKNKIRWNRDDAISAPLYVAKPQY